MPTMIFLWLKWRHIVWILILFKFLYCFCYTIQDYFACQFFAYKAFIGLLFKFSYIVHTCVIYGLKDILLQSLANVYYLILLLYIFHSTTRYDHYLLLFLHHVLYISLLISTIFTRIILEKFRDFLFLFSSHYILLTHYLLKKIFCD